MIFSLPPKTGIALAIPSALPVHVYGSVIYSKSQYTFIAGWWGRYEDFFPKEIIFVYYAELLMKIYHTSGSNKEKHHEWLLFSFYANFSVFNNSDLLP